MRTIFLLVFLTAAASHTAFSQTQAESLVSIDSDEAGQHLLGDFPYVRTASANPTQEEMNLRFEGLRVRVTVNAAGGVDSAECQCNKSSYPELAARAESAAREVKYKPFVRDGQPVRAQFDQWMMVLPAELKPLRHVEFPVVNDWNTVRISLRRTLCYGRCPAYRVEIHGDGTVIYEGEKFVAETGQRKGKISQDAVRELVGAFRDADYYSLQDEYRAHITDNPTYETSIEIDGHLKQVTDYVGLHIGMPFSVKKLEDLIDQAANTPQWTGVGGRNH
jgi:hypothetical protein